MISKLITRQIKQELETIRQANSGKLIPADVVDSARPEDSPLHSHFTWDDSEAAEKWRMEQARELIKSVKITRYEEQVSAYVNVQVRSERYYQSVEVMTVDELESALKMAQVRLAGAIKALESLQAIAHSDIVDDVVSTVKSASLRLAA